MMSESSIKTIKSLKEEIDRKKSAVIKLFMDIGVSSDSVRESSIFIHGVKYSTLSIAGLFKAAERGWLYGAGKSFNWFGYYVNTKTKEFKEKLQIEDNSKFIEIKDSIQNIEDELLNIGILYNKIKEVEKNTIASNLSKEEQDERNTKIQEELPREYDFTDEDTRNIDHFKATLDFLTNENANIRKECDSAVENLKEAYKAYQDEVKKIPKTDIGSDVSTPGLVGSIKGLKDAREKVTELAGLCKNLLGEKPPNIPKSTLRKVITGIMNVFRATGDATMYLQGEKLLAEVRLSNPDRNMLRKTGDYLLKMMINLAQFFLNATVKMRAFAANTKLHDSKIGYRDQVKDWVTRKKGPK
jgi:hypothetical protein